MGVARVALMTPPPLRQIPVVKRALVVGGGVAGLEMHVPFPEKVIRSLLWKKKKNLAGMAAM